MKKIGFDLRGGDNAPHANINAVKRFVAQNSVDEVHVFGLEEDFTELKDLASVKCIFCPQVIETCEEPVKAIKLKKESSLVVGSKMLASKEIDCFISAGSTGALVAAGVFIVKRLANIKRPAISGILPNAKTGKYTMMLDLGANVDAKPEHLVDYAHMAEKFMQNVYDVKNPSIGLLNIGTEENKGNELNKQVFGLLKETNLNFFGNVEPRDVLTCPTDILLMDGYAGNIMLKTLEGATSFFKSTLKRVFMANVMTKFAGLLVKSKYSQEQSKFDHKKIGATPILGVQGMLLKAHGSSDEDAFYYALKNSTKIIESNYVEKIVGDLNNGV